ncbi:MAG: DUF255 domain-containing protein [Campylobacterales bacterium]|nr:DUF255 domain-containing protein [Campylobacterales bacterium]
MKKLLIALLITFANANVNWVNSYEEAQKANKPIFIYIAQKGCHACAHMDKTLSDKTIYEYLNTHFVSFKYDVHHSSKLPKELRSNRTPTLHFLDKEGNKLIESYIGAAGVKRFYQMLQSATK